MVMQMVLISFIWSSGYGVDMCLDSGKAQIF